jgi:hypothetical protein
MDRALKGRQRFDSPTGEGTTLVPLHGTDPGRVTPGHWSPGSRSPGLDSWSRWGLRQVRVREEGRPRIRPSYSYSYSHSKTQGEWSPVTSPATGGRGCIVPSPPAQQAGRSRTPFPDTFQGTPIPKPNPPCPPDLVPGNPKRSSLSTSSGHLGLPHASHPRVRHSTRLQTSDSPRDRLQGRPSDPPRTDTV